MEKDIMIFAVCFSYTCLMLWVGAKAMKYRLRGLCQDCGEPIEQDGLCHDCRARLWGEQGQG